MQLGYCGYCSDKTIDRLAYEESWRHLKSSPQLTPERCTEVTERLTTPIHSQGGCDRQTHTKGKATSKQLPLISGMPKSADVDEITQRLYSTRHTKTVATFLYGPVK